MLPAAIEIVFKILIISNTVCRRRICGCSVLSTNIAVTALTYVLSWLFMESEIVYGTISFMHDIFDINSGMTDNYACAYSNTVLVICMAKMLCLLAEACNVRHVLSRIPRECVVGCSLATGIIHIANEARMHDMPTVLLSAVLTAVFLVLFFRSRMLFSAAVVLAVVANYVVYFAVSGDCNLFFGELRISPVAVPVLSRKMAIHFIGLRALLRSSFSVLAILLFTAIEIEIDSEVDRMQLVNNMQAADSSTLNETGSGTHTVSGTCYAMLMQFVSRHLCTLANLCTFFLPFTIKKAKKRFSMAERVLVCLIVTKLAVLILFFRMFIPRILHASLSMFLGMFIVVMALREFKKFCLPEQLLIVMLGVLNAVLNQFVVSIAVLTPSMYLACFVCNRNTDDMVIDKHHRHVVYDREQISNVLPSDRDRHIAVINLSRYNYIISCEREKIARFAKHLDVENVFILKKDGLFIYAERVSFIRSIDEIDEHLV